MPTRQSLPSRAVLPMTPRRRPPAMTACQAHMARLVLQDPPAYLAQDRILRGFGEHAKERHGKSLSDELKADRLQIPSRGAEQRVEDFPDIACERVGLTV